MEFSDQITSAQCFPLHTILLAADRTAIDLFSLDVEGHELKVLKTIPWHKVDIKVKYSEQQLWSNTMIIDLFWYFDRTWQLNGNTSLKALVSFIEGNGYIKVDDVAYDFA